SYSIFFYLPFKLFGLSFYTYLITYFAYIALSFAGIRVIFRKDIVLQSIFLVTYSLATYTYGFRYETVVIMLNIWGIYLISFEHTNLKVYLGYLLFAISFLIHPAASATVGSILVLHALNNANKIGIKKIVICYLIFLAIAISLLGFSIDNYTKPFFSVSEFGNRLFTVNLFNPLKWILLSSVLAWILLDYLLSKRPLLNKLVLLGLFAIFFLLRTSYYYPYIVTLLIIEYRDQPVLTPLVMKLFSKGVLVLHTIVFFGIFYAYPIIKLFENHSYADQFKSNIHYVEHYVSDSCSRNKVYIDRQLAVGCLDNTCIRNYLFNHKDLFYGKKVNIKGGDRIFLIYKKDLTELLGNPSYVLNDTAIEVKEIHKPVKGLLTITGSRTDSLGLWMIKSAN
ncbi:MAG: hypothetical protein ABIS01_00980, partial [Ferruginibacter sp.]